MTEWRATSVSEPSARGLGGILIVGLAHSGKTEVRRILDTSPRVTSSRHNRTWRRISADTRRRSSIRQIEEYSESVRRDDTISSWDVDVDAVIAQWRSMEEQTLSGLLALLHDRDAKNRDADMWCAQINRMEQGIERILTELPEIKVIHTIRDPRDGLGVARRSGLVGRRGWDLASWAQSAQVAISSRTRHPERYMIVRWEDLVTSPEIVCESLGDFIGVSVDVPSSWHLAHKCIGRGVGGRRTYQEIRPLLDSLGYTPRPRTDSALSDIVDLLCYRLHTRHVRSRSLEDGS